MPKLQDSYTMKGEDAKFWGSASCVPSPCTLCFRLCEKQTAQLQGQGQDKRELTLDQWPTTTARKDLAHLSLLKSVLVTRRDSVHTLKGEFSKWITSRGGMKMQEGGETGHWRYSGRGKAKGRSLSSSSTNPYKIRRNTTFLPHHTYSYQKKKKIH